MSAYWELGRSSNVRGLRAFTVSGRSEVAFLDSAALKTYPKNGRGLSRFCAVRGAKWDCPPLRPDKLQLRDAVELVRYAARRVMEQE